MRAVHSQVRVAPTRLRPNVPARHYTREIIRPRNIYKYETVTKKDQGAAGYIPTGAGLTGLVLGGPLGGVMAWGLTGLFMPNDTIYQSHTVEYYGNYLHPDKLRAHHKEDHPISVRCYNVRNELIAPAPHMPKRDDPVYFTYKITPEFLSDEKISSIWKT